MSLNIKNPETHRLARELAAVTGETVTSAITTAVRERLERVTDTTTDAHRTERLRALSSDAGPRWSPELRIGDPSQFLYDSAGLPE